VSVTLDPNGKVNFSSAVVLLVEQSPFSIDVLSQIFKGVGARNLHRAAQHVVREHGGRLPEVCAALR